MQRDDKMDYKKEFIELVKNNPELDIVPMVNRDILGDYHYDFWEGTLGKSYIEEVFTEDEMIWRKSKDLNEMEDYLSAMIFGYGEEITEEEIQAKVKEIMNDINWRKVIILNIETI